MNELENKIEDLCIKVERLYRLFTVPSKKDCYPVHHCYVSDMQCFQMEGKLVMDVKGILPFFVLYCPLCGFTLKKNS